METFETQ